MTALEAIISSYDMSVLYLDRVRWSRPQIIALGLSSTAVMMGMVQSKPLTQLSPIRSPRSVFHPSLFLSIIGQAACHVSVTTLLVAKAQALIPP